MRRATIVLPNGPVAIPRANRPPTGSRNLFGSKVRRVSRSVGRGVHPVCPAVRPRPHRNSRRIRSREPVRRGCRSDSPALRPDCRDAVRPSSLRRRSNLRRPSRASPPSRVSSALRSIRSRSIPSRHRSRRISVRRSHSRRLRTGCRSVGRVPRRVLPVERLVRKVQRPQGFRAAGPVRPPDCRRGPSPRRNPRQLYCRVRPPSRLRVLPTAGRSRRRATRRTLLVIATGRTRRRRPRSSSPGKMRGASGPSPRRTLRSSRT